MDRSLPSPGDHPQSIPSISCFLILSFVQFFQRDEMRVPALCHARKVHGLIHERGFHERAVHVPTGAAHARTPLVLVVRDPEDVGVRGFRVFVKRGFHSPEPTRQFDLPLSGDGRLVAK